MNADLKELVTKYHASQMAFDTTPTDDNRTKLGQAYARLRTEMLRQTGRTERRDDRRWGDPAAVYERRAS